MSIFLSASVQLVIEGRARRCAWTGVVRDTQLPLPPQLAGLAACPRPARLSSRRKRRAADRGPGWLGRVGCWGRGSPPPPLLPERVPACAGPIVLENERRLVRWSGEGGLCPLCLGGQASRDGSCTQAARLGAHPKGGGRPASTTSYPRSKLSERSPARACTYARSRLLPTCLLGGLCPLPTPARTQPAPVAHRVLPSAASSGAAAASGRDARGLSWSLGWWRCRSQVREGRWASPPPFSSERHTRARHLSARLLE